MFSENSKDGRKIKKWTGIFSLSLLHLKQEEHYIGELHQMVVPMLLIGLHLGVTIKTKEADK